MESVRSVPLISGGCEPNVPDLKSGSDTALAADAQRKADRFLLLSDACRELMVQRAVPDICSALYTQTKRLVDCTVLYVGLYSQERQEIDIVLTMDAGIAYPLRSARAVETLIGRAITSRQPFVYRSGSGRDQVQPFVQEARGPRSALFVPMIAGDRVVGAAAVHTFRERAYDQGDIVVLQALASQAAVAIENARLFEQTRAWVSKLEAVQNVSADLHRCETAGELGAETARALRTLLPFDTYRVMLVEDATQDLVTLTQGASRAEVGGPQPGDHRVCKGEGAFGRCASSGEPVLINEATVGARSEEAGVVPPREQSILAVPLLHDKALIGVLGVTKRGYKQYSADHVRLLRFVADHVASAVFTTLVLEQTKQRLDRLNDLDQSRTECISTIRHELRAPLASIVSYTDTLLRFWDRLTVLHQKEMVHTIQVSSTRLQRLVEDLPCHSGLDGAHKYSTDDSASSAAVDEHTGVPKAPGPGLQRESAQTAVPLPILPTATPTAAPASATVANTSPATETSTPTATQTGTAPVRGASTPVLPSAIRTGTPTRIRTGASAQTPTITNTLVVGQLAFPAGSGFFALYYGYIQSPARSDEYLQAFVAGYPNFLIVGDGLAARSDIPAYLHSQSIKALQYVALGFGAGNADTIDTTVDTAMASGYDGIFFDQVSTASGDGAFQTARYGHVKHHGAGKLVIMNPGLVPPDASMFSYADIVSVENQYAARIPSSWGIPAWRWLAVQGDPATSAAASAAEAERRASIFRSNGGFWYYSSGHASSGSSAISPVPSWYGAFATWVTGQGGPELHVAHPQGKAAADTKGAALFDAAPEIGFYAAAPR